MQVPDAEELRFIVDRVETEHPLLDGDAKKLVALIYSLMTPDHTWWRATPIPPGQIMLLANDSSITPPMVFKTQDEADMFAKMNQTQMYIPIPKPPCLDEVQKNPARN